MNKGIIIILGLLISVTLNAQEYSINWGEEAKMKGSDMKLFGYDGEHYHLLTYSKKKPPKIFKYDLSHKLVSEKTTVSQMPTVLSYFHSKETKNGIFNVSAYNDKRKEKCDVYISHFKKETFTKPKKVLSHEYKQLARKLYPKDATRLNYINHDFSTNWATSRDSSYVVFSNSVCISDGLNPERIMFTLFDADMKKVWSKIHSFDYADKDIEMLQVLPDNEGRIYVLAKEKNKRAAKKKSKELVKHDFKVFRVTEDKIETFDVVLDGKIYPTITAMHLFNNETSAFSVSGFYSDAGFKANHLGTFCLMFNEDGVKQRAESYPFEKDLLTGIVKNKDLEKGTGLGDEFLLEGKFYLDNGSFGFINEYFFYNPGQEVINFKTNELVITLFSKNGTLINVEKIGKKYRNNHLSKASFLQGVVGNKLYLVYNDFKTKNGKKGSDGAFTDLTVINSEGIIETQKTLFTDKELKFLFAPGWSSISDKGILLGTFRFALKKYRFGLIDVAQ